MSVEDAAQIFLSTPSARRATLKLMDVHEPGNISIHALREEGDSATTMCRTGSGYFYPRPPRGGRQTTFELAMNRAKFLSTPSARRATTKNNLSILPGKISIHALREEGDRRKAGAMWRTADISIHALREEGDHRFNCHTGRRKRFLSTPSARRATKATGDAVGQLKISIHALREEGD